jgi:hypothetical protein
MVGNKDMNSVEKTGIFFMGLMILMGYGFNPSRIGQIMFLIFGLIFIFGHKM